VLTPVSGRFFSRKHIENRERVVVLSTTTSQKLFGPDANPVGRAVETRKAVFTVIGVVDRPGGFASAGAGPASFDEVFIPYTTLQDVLRK